MNIDELTTYERDTVLRYLLYVMDVETRQELMRRMPVEYNKLAGETVMIVTRAKDRVAVANADASSEQINFEPFSDAEIIAEAVKRKLASKITDAAWAGTE